MHQVRTTCFAAAALILAAMPAHAFAAKPDFNAPYPVQHAKEGALAPAQPYPMNYTDQMAQSLGVRDGKWEAFTSKDPLAPSLGAGMGRSGPMLQLQWKP
jgi:hypothetical protein